MNTENALTLEDVLLILGNIDVIYDSRFWVCSDFRNPEMAEDKLIEAYRQIACEIMGEPIIDEDSFSENVRSQEWFAEKKFHFFLANMRQKYSEIAAGLVLLESGINTSVIRGIEIISQYPSEEFLSILLEKLLHSSNVDVCLAIAEAILTHFPPKFWYSDHKETLSLAIQSETHEDVLTVLYDIKDSV